MRNALKVALLHYSGSSCPTFIYLLGFGSPLWSQKEPHVDCTNKNDPFSFEIVFQTAWNIICLFVCLTTVTVTH